MGSCLSKKRVSANSRKNKENNGSKLEQDAAVTLGRGSAAAPPHSSLPPPPPEEEAVVKEVLTETPSVLPNPKSRVGGEIATVKPPDAAEGTAAAAAAPVGGGTEDRSDAASENWSFSESFVSATPTERERRMKFPRRPHLRRSGGLRRRRPTTTATTTNSGTMLGPAVAAGARRRRGMGTRTTARGPAEGPPHRWRSGRRTVTLPAQAAAAEEERGRGRRGGQPRRRGWRDPEDGAAAEGGARGLGGESSRLPGVLHLPLKEWRLLSPSAPVTSHSH
ncbi:unnamed protein product [Spirodela intermedia]|uniref:Uncharacterized protein n=1 Tax=Spirodela intermedia TaxID=51605 RepID=A0A7I8JFA5_SPIIN|nr:unnamed protein product [Spirodela intermedia]CAA6668809.1 unnamed protein product [Spirodela intermedia]